MVLSRGLAAHRLLVLRPWADVRVASPCDEAGRSMNLFMGWTASPPGWTHWRVRESALQWGWARVLRPDGATVSASDCPGISATSPSVGNRGASGRGAPLTPHGPGNRSCPSRRSHQVTALHNGQAGPGAA